MEKSQEMMDDGKQKVCASCSCIGELIVIRAQDKTATPSANHGAFLESV